MFTGIIQGIAQLTTIQDEQQFRRYTVRLPEEMAVGLTIGSSIANDGCCLTITHIAGIDVSFDLMAETLTRTTLGDKSVGDHINVERAAKFGDEIGGHLMSGHIACKGNIVDIVSSAHNHQLIIAVPPEFEKYILYKGFIGIDGISLTVGEVIKNRFAIHLIPETIARTTIGHKKKGDAVNIEIDLQTQVIVDTVTRILQKTPPC